LLLASTDRGAKWNAAGDNGEQKGKGASEDDAAAVAGRTRCSKPQTGRQGQGVLAQGLGVAPSPPGLCAYEQGGKLGAAEQRAASGSALAAGCDVTPPEHRPASTTLPPRLLLLPSPLSPAPTCFKDMTNKENRDMLELECSYYFSPLQIIF
jgi:hypothetical protein